MRKWLVELLADVLVEVLQRALPDHVPYCDHGYIAIACGYCRAQERP